MEVRLADCAGFCFGVKRAVDTVYEQLKTERLYIPMVPLYTTRKWSENCRKGCTGSGEQRGSETTESRGEHSYSDHPCSRCGKRDL